MYRRWVLVKTWFFLCRKRSDSLLQAGKAIFRIALFKDIRSIQDYYKYCYSQISKMISKSWNMKAFLHSTGLIIFSLMISPAASGEIYIEVAPSLIEIDTDNAKSTHPLLADFRLGYETTGQQLEVALMLGINDDRLNQLTVDVPFAFSAFYRYLPEVDSSIKLHFILGVSHIEVESSYPGIADSTDRFDGVSFGFGFEESFEFNPQFKLSFDWIRLYHGDRLNINAAGLGLHYEF